MYVKKEETMWHKCFICQEILIVDNTIILMHTSFPWSLHGNRGIWFFHKSTNYLTISCVNLADGVIDYSVSGCLSYLLFIKINSRSSALNALFLFPNSRSNLPSSTGCLRYLLSVWNLWHINVPAVWYPIYITIKWSLYPR